MYEKRKWHETLENNVRITSVYDSKELIGNAISTRFERQQLQLGLLKKDTEASQHYPNHTYTQFKIWCILSPKVTAQSHSHLGIPEDSQSVDTTKFIQSQGKTHTDRTILWQDCLCSGLYYLNQKALSRVLCSVGGPSLMDRVHRTTIRSPSWILHVLEKSWRVRKHCKKEQCKRYKQHLKRILSTVWWRKQRKI